LDKAFGGGCETWIRLQAAYDLAQAEKKAGDIKVKRVVQKSDGVFV
jgi:plasmid maintenance system antidote protein VapI